MHSNESSGREEKKNEQTPPKINIINRVMIHLRHERYFIVRKRKSQYIVAPQNVNGTKGITIFSSTYNHL